MMGEWWTYRPSDFLLFSARTWHRQIALHNEAIWPSQLAWIAVALALAAMIARGRDPRGRIAGVVLGAAWLWVAWAFHVERYAQIHWGAHWFAAAFAIEGAALVALSLTGRGLALRRPDDAASRVAFALLVLSIVAFPAIAPLAGRPWSTAHTFGSLPDPTALATLALLALSGSRRRHLLVVVPVAWGAIAAVTAWTLHAHEWLAIAIGTVAGLLLALRRTSSPVGTLLR